MSLNLLQLIYLKQKMYSLRSCVSSLCSALPGRLHQPGAGEIPAGHHQLHAFLQWKQRQEHTQRLHLHTYEHLWWVDKHTVNLVCHARVPAPSQWCHNTVFTYIVSNLTLQSCWFLVHTDSSDKLRQPKIGALMKQVMGAKEDVPGTFSRGGETFVYPHAAPVGSLLASLSSPQSCSQNKCVNCVLSPKYVTETGSGPGGWWISQSIPCS